MEELIDIEDLAELLHDASLLPFVKFENLPRESLNAVQNFLASEILSVRHQLRFFTQHHASLYATYQETVWVAQSHCKVSIDEPSPSSNPLGALEPAASSSNTSK